VGCWVLEGLMLTGRWFRERRTGNLVWQARRTALAIDKDFTVRVQRRIANRCRNTNNSTSQKSSTIQPSKSASRHSV
jgi:hypothetical protein